MVYLISPAIKHPVYHRLCLVAIFTIILYSFFTITPVMVKCAMAAKYLRSHPLNKEIKNTSGRYNRW
jgi:hypothetical protein